MAQERASLGFGNELENFDPDGWKSEPAARKRPSGEEAKHAAEAAGFRSREPETLPAAPEPVVPKPQRRRRTGRNVQFNLKTRAEAIEAFTRIADANDWGLGETFEYALALLEKDQTSRNRL